MTRSHYAFGPLVVSLVALFLSGTSTATAQTVPAEEYMELYDDGSYAQTLAEAAVTDLTQLLGWELKNAMSEGGALSAIHVCSSRAQAITDSLSKGYGVDLRRISSRFRNPANAPTQLERDILNRFRNKDAPPDTIFVVGEGEDRFYLYLKQIRIEKMLCLRCHGPAKRIDPGVRKMLGVLYPDDVATGFSLNDLRGAFSVRVPVSAGPRPDTPDTPEK